MASQTMQNAGQSQRSAAYELWSEALLQVLLPQLPEDQRGAPVLLACDDEAVSAAAEALGLTEADAVQKFGRCVELRYALAATGSVEGVRRDAVGPASHHDRPRGRLRQLFAQLRLDCRARRHFRMARLARAPRRLRTSRGSCAVH
jgi:hypothetical protein